MATASSGSANNNADSSDFALILKNVGNPAADHTNLQPTLIGYNIVAIFIAVVAILLRTSVRVFIIKRVLTEDYFMLAAGVPAIALSALIIAGVDYGLGKNLWDLNLLTILDNVKSAVQILLFCQCLHAAALTLVKLSILSTYWRLFPSRSIKYTLFVLATFITSVAIITVFGTLFQCRPISAAWDFSIQNAHCIQVRNVFFFSTASSVVTDVLLCIIPMPLIWKLKISLQERIILCCLFGLGLFAAAASSMRLTRLINGVGQINVTMVPMEALGWSVAEVITGVVCACVPTYKPLAKKIFPAGAFSYVRSQGPFSGSNAGRTIGTRASAVSEIYVIQGAADPESPRRAHSSLGMSIDRSGRAHKEHWYQLRSISSWRDRTRLPSQTEQTIRSQDILMTKDKGRFEQSTEPREMV